MRCEACGDDSTADDAEIERLKAEYLKLDEQLEQALRKNENQATLIIELADALAYFLDAGQFHLEKPRSHIGSVASLRHVNRAELDQNGPAAALDCDFAGCTRAAERVKHGVARPRTG
jgi:hypothetical protein